MFTERLSRLQSKMTVANIDVALITDDDNVYFPQSGLKPPTLVGKTFKRAPKALMNH